MDLRTMALVSECIKRTAHFVDEEELYLREELAVTRPAKTFVITHLEHFPRIFLPTPRQAVPFFCLPCAVRCCV